MFTINIYLKFALIALFLGGGIILTFFQGLVWSWPLILVGLILLASYIFLGTIQSAAQLVQESKFDEAENRLALTFKPGWLYVTNRAMYYIMKGSISMQKNDTKQAEDYFDTALNMKLPSDNEKGMVLLQMAGIKGQQNKWNAAKNYFREAKKLNITEGQLKEQLNMFEKAINNRGQANVARSMGRQGMKMMKGGGGKRRRPKMR